MITSYSTMPIRARAIAALKGDLEKGQV